MYWLFICLLGLVSGADVPDADDLKNVLDLLHETLDPPETTVLNPLTAPVEQITESMPKVDELCREVDLIKAQSCHGSTGRMLTGIIHGMLDRVDVTAGADRVSVMNIDAHPGQRQCQPLTIDSWGAFSPCHRTELRQPVQTWRTAATVDCTGPHGCAIWVEYHDTWTKKRHSFPENWPLRGDRALLRVVQMSALPEVFAGIFTLFEYGQNFNFFGEGVFRASEGTGPGQVDPQHPASNAFDGTGKSFLLHGGLQNSNSRVNLWGTLVTTGEAEIYNYAEVYPGSMDARFDPDAFVVFGSNEKLWPADGPLDFNRFEYIDDRELGWPAGRPRQPGSGPLQPGTRSAFHFGNKVAYATYLFMFIQFAWYDSFPSYFFDGPPPTITLEIAELVLQKVLPFPNSLATVQEGMAGEEQLRLAASPADFPAEHPPSNIRDSRWNSFQFTGPTGALGLVMRQSWGPWRHVTALRIYPAITSILYNPIKFHVYGTNAALKLENAPFKLADFTLLGSGQFNPVMSLPIINDADDYLPWFSGQVAPLTPAPGAPIGRWNFLLIRFGAPQGHDERLELSEVIIEQQ